MVQSKKLTYKTLFLYSLLVIALLIVAVPVVAAKSSSSNLLDFSFKAEPGRTAQSSQTLTNGINIDHLEPGQANWYAFSPASLNDPQLTWLSLALRYESEAQIDPTQVNFEVFSQAPQNGWFNQTALPQERVGQGLRSPLPTPRQNLVESFWSGQIADQGYFVRVFNNSPVGLDFSLEVKGEQPLVSSPVAADGTTNPGAAATSLNGRQLAWTLTAQAVEHMSATEAAHWMKQAQAVGWLVTEGTTVEAVPSPAAADPQILWNLTAQAIAGQEAGAAAQWLIQADALGWLTIPLDHTLPTLRPAPETPAHSAGAEATLPSAPLQPETDYLPINIYPNNPLTMQPDTVNSGRLLPYGEHWYEFTLSDLDDELIENMKLTMFFTPRLGYISDRVNFEIIPAGQYHIWQRGDADYLESIGLGMWVSRDEDANTGERLWSGSLVDGDSYLIKVKNGTPDVVDYYLFPDDVENAELGQPTLHASDAASGYVPYLLSPPTRAGAWP
jgi:hypothetical protein